MGFFRLPNSKVFSKKSTKFAELVCAEKLAEATWALCQDLVKGIHIFGRTENLQFSKRFESVCSYKISQVFLGTVINIYIYMEIQNPMKFMMILSSCRTIKCFSEFYRQSKEQPKTVEIHFLGFLAPESFANHHQPPRINTSSRNCEGIARAAQELLNAHGFAHTRFPWPKSRWESFHESCF